MFEHLRAHVVGGAREGGGHVVGAHENPRDPKVSQLDEVITKEDVPERINQLLSPSLPPLSPSLPLLSLPHLALRSLCRTLLS